jgi:hypothetical protein
MRRGMLAVAALLGAAAIFTVPAATAATVIGQTGGAGNAFCGANLIRVQTGVASSGASHTVPDGTWVLDSWSTAAGQVGGQMAAVVVRPTGTPNQYLVVGASTTETLTGGTLNTFATSIDVQGGDLLGLWTGAFATCGSSTGNPGDTAGLAFQAKPAAGDTLTLPFTQPSVLLDISATLTSTAATPTSPGQTEGKKSTPSAPPPRAPDHSFLCYSTFQVDPGTWLTSESAALLAQGYWLPFAEKTTPTATAIGNGYYLSCQKFTPTGSLVSADGTDLGEHPELANTPGYYPEGT